MSSPEDPPTSSPTPDDNTDAAAATNAEILTIELPHLRVAALAWGRADGQLVLCLHGYPDTAWTWRYLGPGLAAHGYRVVAPFTRGYAPTEIPADGDYHVGALMYDAIALHHKLRGNSNAVVIGHDWGGFTAAALAAHPDSPFAKAVVLATPLLPAFREGISASALRSLPTQLRNSWYVLYQQLPGIPERTINRVIPRLWRDWTPPTYDHSRDVARIAAALPDRAHRFAALSYYRHQFQPRRQQPKYRALHRTWRTKPYRIPMLLVHGAADGGLDIRLATFSARALPAGSRHKIIDGAGHFVHLDEPELMTKLVLEYLGEPAAIDRGSGA